MSKSFGKFLLFSAVAGAAAYGAYSYLQKKEQTVAAAADEDADDDFDDFSEDLDEDLTSGRERSYVSLNLDKAEAIATEAFHKAKEAINDSGALLRAKEVITDSVQQVRETVKSVTDSQGSHTSFTDLSEVLKEKVEDADDHISEAAKTVNQKAEDIADKTEDIVDQAEDKINETEDQIEEFFDDDDSSDTK